MAKFQPFDLKCSQNKAVIKYCESIQCPSPPFVCQFQECSCQKPHFQCCFRNILALEQRLEKKSKSVYPLFKQIFDWFKDMIETLNKELKQAQKICQDMSLVLLDDEKKLYSLLKKKDTSTITSKFLSSVYKSLASNIQYDQKNIINNKIKAQLAKSKQEILQSLITMNKQIKIHREAILTEKINPKFSSTLHHPQISIQDRIIEAISTNGLKTALFQQSVEKFGQKKQTYIFNIQVTSEASIMFGLCHVNEAIAKNYSDTFGPNNGGYMIFGNNGKIYMHKGDMPQRNQNQIRKISQNDQLFVVFNPGDSALQFINTTTNNRDKIVVKKIPDNPLHISVIMYHQKDKVQFKGLRLQ